MGMDFEAVHASGAVVEDRSGRKYVDCIGGYGNVNVGHNHPHVIEAMTVLWKRAGPLDGRSFRRPTSTWLKSWLK